jgi:hypothetical protein
MQTRFVPVVYKPHIDRLEGCSLTRFVSRAEHV